MDRTTVSVDCPGTGSNYVVLVPTAAQAQYGVGHPENTGECSLYIVGLDADGNAMDPHTRIDPGHRRHWYYPPSGAAQVAVMCSSTCHGDGEIEFDTPIG